MPKYGLVIFITIIVLQETTSRKKNFLLFCLVSFIFYTILGYYVRQISTSKTAVYFTIKLVRKSVNPLHSSVIDIFPFLPSSNIFYLFFLLPFLLAKKVVTNCYVYNYPHAVSISKSVNSLLDFSISYHARSDGINFYIIQVINAPTVILFLHFYKIQLAVLFMYSEVFSLLCSRIPSKSDMYKVFMGTAPPWCGMIERSHIFQLLYNWLYYLLRRAFNSSCTSCGVSFLFPLSVFIYTSFFDVANNSSLLTVFT